MSDRMIFFPHKRRTNMRLVAKITGLVALTAAIFLAGFQVGVGIGAKHAAFVDSTRSLKSLSLAHADLAHADNVSPPATMPHVQPISIVTE